jgi:hypothetical protein
VQVLALGIHVQALCVFSGHGTCCSLSSAGGASAASAGGRVHVSSAAAEAATSSAARCAPCFASCYYRTQVLSLFSQGNQAVNCV